MKKVFLVLASVVFSLVVMEVFLRIFISSDQNTKNLPPEKSPMIHIRNSERVYGYRPSLPLPFETNELGFRGPDRKFEKESNVYRILVLGDSIPFGAQVREFQTYPRLVEKFLNADEDNYRYEVINLGVQGYNTKQELATLREVGIKFKPDLLILSVCMNDSDPAKKLWRSGLRNTSRTIGFDNINVRNIVEISYVLVFLKTKILTVVMEHLGDNSTWLAFLNSPSIYIDPRVQEESWRSMKQDMDEMYLVSREQGIPMAAFLFPYRSQVHLTDSDRVPQKDLIEFFGRRNIPVLDRKSVV